MTALILKNTAFSLALIVLIGGLSQCSQSAYAVPAHPHGESGLVTSNYQSAQPRQAVFLCVPFGYAPFMVWLNGDTFACAGFFDGLLTNLIQSNHPHLVMNGSTSLNIKGVMHHD